MLLGSNRITEGGQGGGGRISLEEKSAFLLEDGDSRICQGSVCHKTWTVLCWTGKSLMSSFSDLHLVYTAYTQATEAEFARHSRSRYGLALLGFRKRDKVEHRS